MPPFLLHFLALPWMNNAGPFCDDSHASFYDDAPEQRKRQHGAHFAWPSSHDASIDGDGFWPASSGG